MLSLREYRNKADRLADFLPWAALVAPGVVLIQGRDFTCVTEGMNAIEAWLGSRSHVERH
jgi:type IV secretory pathway VirB4 component